MDEFKLRNGMSIPCIGYGPDSLSLMAKYKKDGRLVNRVRNKIRKELIERPQYVEMLAFTLKSGCRLIDFSASYGDGSLIAEGVNKSGMKREQVLYTTRISNQAQYDEKIEQEFESQLRGFRTDYMDILMLHWPVTDYFEKTWLKMIELKEKGLCRIIGVANCNSHHLQRLYDISGQYPEIDQFEVHPLFTQKELVSFCVKNGIQVEAYTPIARRDDRIYNPPVMKKLSDKYHKSITQLILRWHIQNGIIPIIRSMNKDHMRHNLDVFDFHILEEDMKLIDGMNINSRLRYDPDNCDFSAL